MSQPQNFDTRISIDTLYVGVQLLEEEVKPFFEEIKEYLYFKRQLIYNFDRCRNRFYQSEIVSEANGFYFFFNPRKRCNNAPVTIQLTGKFFRRLKESAELVNFLVSFDESRIEFQRVDVALDLLWKDLSLANFSKITNCMGFPFPHYSENWKYNKIPFNIYGRYHNDSYIINMVSCGKNDVVLRVYDKTLELHEKYKFDYSEYYDLKKKYEQVYRIEIQARSDKLKSLVDSVRDCDIRFDCYESICYILYHYIMQKFYFEDYIFEFDTTNYALNPHVYESTASGRYAYHRRMQAHHFRKACDEWENMKIESEMDKLPVSWFKKQEFVKESNSLEESVKDILDFYKEAKQLELEFDIICPMDNSFDDYSAFNDDTLD